MLGTKSAIRVLRIKLGSQQKFTKPNLYHFTYELLKKSIGLLKKIIRDYDGSMFEVVGKLESVVKWIMLGIVKFYYINLTI